MSNSGSGGEDIPVFICCVNVQQPKIHEVWTYGEDVVTPEVHPTAGVDVGAGFVGKFSTDCLTPTWSSIPMFGRNYINGIVEWIGVPDLMSNDGPPWNFNLLDPYANWRDRGSSTSLKRGNGSGGNYKGVSIL